MSESKRKVFTGTQKAKVALTAVKGLKTINEIAQEFSVHPTQVNQWKKELMDNAGSLFNLPVIYIIPTNSLNFTPLFINEQ